MDSPHLLHLGFLLLALAAPRPSISMSSVGPAKRTQDSPSVKTTVSVYHCKDCESSICQARPISFENFEKIAETHNTTFSNRKIELVTGEKHIIMCFQQRNSLPEGICGIYWEKAEGAGFSCGILNSGENGRGNISTEENIICCEAETNLWNPNPTLKCYAQKSHPEFITLRADIPDEGIPGNLEFLTSKKNSTGILFAFVFVGVCTGWAIVHYLRLRRRQASAYDR